MTTPTRRFQDGANIAVERHGLRNSQTGDERGQTNAVPHAPEFYRRPGPSSPGAVAPLEVGAIRRPETTAGFVGLASRDRSRGKPLLRAIHRNPRGWYRVPMYVTLEERGIA